MISTQNDAPVPSQSTGGSPNKLNPSLISPFLWNSIFHMSTTVAVGTAIGNRYTDFRPCTHFSRLIASERRSDNTTNSGSPIPTNRSVFFTASKNAWFEKIVR